ncbi:hypothetical protein F9802_03950 [Bacillus aerolatus]|uniref:Uncharacterized protein n=1 Tax=Bacillus aerolatus TaxID=2653354 RepID=A0A6I1FSX6_9BACI|nr:hypothetical protein [Bacillus aerolatus]KAB7707875.1 hypothetical protein F9802_03950 [Bacillus aerolatus]
MTEAVLGDTALEWHSDHLKIYDPSIGIYRKVQTINEAKKLIKQSSEPFICIAAAIYAFTLAAARAAYTTEINAFVLKLERECSQLKKLLKHSPLLGELLNRLLETSRQSQSVNGIKTDIYHEAIHLSIKVEEYFNMRECLKRRA